MASLDFNNEKENFYKYYDSHLQIFTDAAKTWELLIKSIVKEFAIESVSSRVKDREGCIDKFNRKYRQNLEEKQEQYEIQEYISDLIGIRIVCLYQADIYTISGKLEKEFNLLYLSDREKFNKILFPSQSNSFNEWLERQNQENSTNYNN